MTEEERQERIRRLQERRAATTAGDAPAQQNPPHRLEIGIDDTEELSTGDAARTERLERLAQRRGQPRGEAADPRPAGRRRAHKAPASRIASAGAGIALTMSLMASMAEADRVVDPQSVPDGGQAAAAETPVAPTSPTAPATLTAATPAGIAPVVIVPVRKERHTVVVGGNTAGSVRSGGGQTAAPPPPPPTTKSHGSK